MRKVEKKLKKGLPPLVCKEEMNYLCALFFGENYAKKAHITTNNIKTY